MNFLEEATGYKETKRDKVLLIDTNNLSMRCLFALAYDPTDTSFTIYKNAFLTSLCKSVRQFKPNKIIFCMEGFHNWRRDVFTDYKCSRAPGREASPVDFDAFFQMNNEFIEDSSKSLQNCLFLKVHRLEADDLIALTTKYMPQWDITLISTDKDFYQLHKYPNFKQWDPIKNKFIQVIDPNVALMQKIITGDKSDDIPQLKKGVGPKTVEKILIEGLQDWLTKNDLQQRFDENRRLIDFDFIPKEFHQPVIDILENWKQGKFNGREFYNFVVKHGMGVALETLDEKIETFSQIRGANEEPAEPEKIDIPKQPKTPEPTKTDSWEQEHWFCNGQPYEEPGDPSLRQGS